LLRMLRRLVGDGSTQCVGKRVDVATTKQLTDCRRPNVSNESRVVLLLRFCTKREVFLLVQQLTRRDLLLTGLDDDVIRVIDDLLEVTQRDVEEVSHRARQRLEEPDVRDRDRELDV